MPIQEDGAEMKVSGGKRRIERDRLLKLRHGLIVLLVLGEQGSEGVVERSVIRGGGESELQLFLRGIGFRDRGERGGVRDCDFGGQGLRGVYVRAAEELKQLDGFHVFVELSVREGEVGYGSWVPAVEFVSQLELRHSRAEGAFSEENGAVCSVTGSYCGCQLHKFCKLDVGGMQVVSLIGGLACAKSCVGRLEIGVGSRGTLIFSIRLADLCVRGSK